MLGPSVVKCAATSPPAGAVAASGGTASIGVLAAPECAWTAAAQSAWLTDLTPAAGQGNGQIQFKVAVNPTATARQADILLNDVLVPVTQQASPCAFAITPRSIDVEADGGVVNLVVETMEGCGWNVTSGAPWITVTGAASRNGPGAAEISIAANTGAARSGNVAVGGLTVAISQSAPSTAPTPPPTPTPTPTPTCTYAISPTSRSFDAAGGADRTTVITQPGCEWTGSSDVSWIAVAGATGGTGDGLLQFVVHANNGAARSAALTVAGQILAVTQAAAAQPTPPPTSPPSHPPPTACTYAISPGSYNAATGGASDVNVSVTTANGCSWTAVSNAPWLSIPAGTTGSGNGGVKFSVSANSGAERSGTLTVAGQTLTVSQAGACSFTVTPTSALMAAGGGAGPDVAVGTTAGCGWTASTSTPWLTITSGAGGSGPGTVRFSAAPNNGPARSATIAIADRTFTVNQADGCAFGIDPTSQSIGAAGGSGTAIAVSAGTGCAWTAVSNAAWISITSGASGTGNGTVAFSVGASSTPARSGTMTIAGQTFTVSQESGCVFTVAPLSFTLGQGAQSGLTISVTTGAGCTWTAASNAPWIDVTSGAAGTGSGTTVFSVTFNLLLTRNGSLTVAGQTVTVRQDGL